MSHHETNCLMNLIETGPCKTPTFPPSANASSRLNQNVYREAFSNAPRQKISLLPQCPHSTLWIALLSSLLPFTVNSHWLVFSQMQGLFIVFLRGHGGDSAMQ